MSMPGMGSWARNLLCYGSGGRSMRSVGSTMI